MKILGNKLISECTEYDFKQELERKKISHWLKSVSAYANSEGGAPHQSRYDRGRQ